MIHPPDRCDVAGSDGNINVADYWNWRVHRIVRATGTVSTVAGASRLRRGDWRRMSSTMKPLILAATLGVAGLADHAGAQDVAAHVEPYRFEASSGDVVEAQLGSFDVPENRARADSRPITLRFVRFPATVTDPGPPIVYLAGGPGGSGVSAARGSRFPLFMALRKYGDVIAYDQRGTGMSDGPTPATCPVRRSYPADEPLEEGRLRELTVAVATECRQFWAETGVDLSAYNTEASADDLAALAKALGAPSLRLWAISYGTHLGLAVIRRHPGLVERAVLAGVEGPDHTVKLPSTWDAQIGQLERLIEADSMARRRFPNLREQIADVLGRLDREPARIERISGDMGDTVRTTLSRFAVETEVIAALRDPSSMVSVPYLFERMAAGDYSVVNGSVTIGGLSAMPEATDAASGISRSRRARYVHEDSTLLLGGGDQLINAHMAEALGVRDLGEEFRASVRSEIPVLFISGTLDGRTPPANARDVAQGFPGAEHLVIENAGHSDDLFLSSPRILEVMEAFMAARPLPVLRLAVEPPALSEGELSPPLPAELTEAVVGAYARGPADVWRVVRLGVVRSLDARGRETGRTTTLGIRLRGNGFPLAARADSTFYIGPAPATRLRFDTDPSGRVTGLAFTGTTGQLTRLEPASWDSVDFVTGEAWRVAGPFELGPGETCDRTFPAEAAAGSPLAALSGADWVTGTGDDGFVDFEELFDTSPARGVAYAYLELTSERPGEAELRIGTDDDARVYLGGDLVHRYDGARHAWEEQDVVRVSIPAGMTPLLVKVCNRDSDWRFNLRITDLESRSLVADAEEGRLRLHPSGSPPWEKP